MYRGLSSELQRKRNRRDTLRRMTLLSDKQYYSCGRVIGCSAEVGVRDVGSLVLGCVLLYALSVIYIYLLIEKIRFTQKMLRPANSLGPFA